MKTFQHPTFLISLFLTSFFSLQAQDNCQLPRGVTIQNTERSAFYEHYVRNFANRGGHLSTDIKTIPVVVHILYEAIADSLSEERVMQQIEALTLDFRRLNADTMRTRELFKPVAADLHVEFCLVRNDPTGQATTGITWHYVPNIAEQNLYDLMLATQWNPQRYLNIWVSPTIEGGQSSFPWDDHTERVDGFLVGTRVFGTSGDLMEGFGEGGVATHEAGHYLGLYHTFEGGFIWLGECDVPCDTTGDFVCDTPLDWNLAWAIGFCEEGERFCEDGSTFFVQSENFMAYSNDTCWNMFTDGQRIRVRATLDSLRAELVSLENLVTTGCALPTHIPVEPVVNALRLYPQPAKRQVILDFGQTIPSAVVRLFATDGRLLLQTTSEQQQELQLNLPDLPPGMYVIQVSDGHSLRAAKLLVGQ
ncbi:MAG TPA: zinc-dependent metalloprotease [Saprospiraceae bacterium]|nr:zinc-dependent metalloprotease [Saprospiraceae bacterium]HMP23901.1 zinc-dependent metalloprotease [Saprospiraceae bacterium]